jgi:hypothetical protein
MQLRLPLHLPLLLSLHLPLLLRMSSFPGQVYSRKLPLVS